MSICSRSTAQTCEPTSKQEGLFAFDVSQTFLFFTTLYVVFPSLMIYLTLVMPRGITRVLNVALAAVYAVTIVASAVGEWGYFVLGSAAEAALLGAVVYHAWTWREELR
jgi:hypothetical protein